MNHRHRLHFKLHIVRDNNKSTHMDLVELMDLLSSGYEVMETYGFEENTYFILSKEVTLGDEEEDDRGLTN